MTTPYFNAQIRHQVDLIRLEAGETRRVVRILKAADDKIDDILSKHKVPTFGTKSYKRMVERILRVRTEAMDEVRTVLTDDMRRLVDIERTFELRALKRHTSITAPADVHLNTLRAKMFATPFATSPGQMATFDEWVASLKRADAKRIEEALTSASRTGQDARRLLVGTRAARFKDGLLTRTHRNTEAVIRTAFTHLSASVREQLWQANDGIIAYRWTAILDRKLCPVCFSYHGKYVPVQGKSLPKQLRSQAIEPTGLRPTLHANCRCVLVPVFSLEGLGDMQGADEWLGAQSTKVQNSVLGVRRAEMFREGQIDASALTNQQGRLVTLDQFASSST